MRTRTPLTARLEPFDSYWQAPANVEKGYTSFRQYYRGNYVKYLPTDKSSEVLVVSCGPGYLVALLNELGFQNVLGIDSDAEKITHAQKRELNCRVEQAFPFLDQGDDEFDLIVCEQELNHLTTQEMLDFLELCWQRLRPKGKLIVYGLNGANPITGSEALAQNVDHFSTFTEYSLRQVLELANFTNIRVVPLNLYVFYKNPLNYVGLVITGSLHLLFRLAFKLYGKSNRIFTKKIAAVCERPSAGVATA